MKTLYFIGPWDLNAGFPALPATPGEAPVLLVESRAKGQSLPFHRQKLTLVLSAMGHFAEELRAAGHDVRLRNAASYAEAIAAEVREVAAERVVALRPREWGLQSALERAELGAPLTLLDDGGDSLETPRPFLLSRDEFLAWAGDKKQLRMDVFYRWMRKRYGLLLDERGKPVGGKWSYDADNRKAAKGQRPPAARSYPPDAMTAEVMERVRSWPAHWGDLDGFDWPVTRGQALSELEAFIQERLGRFGDFQDAMIDGEVFLWHARLSPMLNLGLLTPTEVMRAAVAAWERGEAPLNAVEGFIRQILGWREFIRGVYWLRMPEMRQSNELQARRPLPDFFWDETLTDMRCVQQAVKAVRTTGYAHHIQRLMVLGNFALLAGVRPIEVSHWFWAGFVDASEWVELPNVHGMALFADTTFTTKPYAASGRYIHKMGDHCGRCRYDVKARHGGDACPFNPLFWDFMVRHRARLSANPRLGMLYRGWDKRSDEDRAAVLTSAHSFLEGLQPAQGEAASWSFEDDAC